jgi:hypothetical protein
MPEPLQYNDARTLECIIELDAGQPLLRIGQRVRVMLRPATGWRMRCAPSQAAAHRPS